MTATRQEPPTSESSREPTSLAAVLFPSPPRAYPGQRVVKIVLRAVHVLCAGVLMGAHVFAVAAEDRSPWLLATLASGLLIVGHDCHQSAAFLLQVRGAIVVGKLAVLVALPAFGDAAAWALGAVVIVSVVSSHAPARFRYFVLLGRGRVDAADSPG